MRTHLRGVIVVLALLASSLAGASPLRAAPEDFTTECPEMTDSIYRLYTAVFLREPDFGGFDGWNENYTIGGWHLLRIAQFFTESPEFEQRYGALSNEQFVDLIYQNVFGRPADAGGKAHWVGELDAGMTRGKMLLFFSESEEYIIQTSTFVPLAGFLRSYTPTTLWGCGLGEGQIRLDQPRRYWDGYAQNFGDTTVTMTVAFIDANGEVLFEGDIVELTPDQYRFQWNMDVTLIDPSFAGRVHGMQYTFTGDASAVTVVAIGTDVEMPSDRPAWGQGIGTLGGLFRS